MRLNLTAVAALMLAATLAACAQPTEPPPAAEPVITMEAAPEQPTEMPTEAPTEVMDAEANAKPAVQLVPLQSPSDVIVGQPAGIAVIAADSDGLSKAELIVDGQVVSTVEITSDTLYQGALTWTPTTAGSYNAGVVVYDTKNNVSEAVAAKVTVYEAGATIPTAVPTETGHTAPPAVSITPSPTELAPGEKLNVHVNAVDATGVVKMDLYIDDKVVDSWVYEGAAGEEPNSAFQTLKWTNTTEGQHDVYVIATNPSGSEGKSVTEKVKVRVPEATVEATP